MHEKLNQFEAGEGWRRRIHEIIFEAHTPLGKLFDVWLLIAILVSVVVVCLETVPSFQTNGVRHWLVATEWPITIMFTVEYILRLICVKKPSRYAFSFYGLVDFLAILPTYAALVTLSGSSFAVIRSLRLLRIFRIFKLIWFMKAADEMGRAVWNARPKIIVFLGIVTITVIIAGTIIYEIEDNIRSIPDGMYWAIVTMTTVGYGDIVPESWVGKVFSAVLILLGYSLIIVPTGFVSAEMFHERAAGRVSLVECSNCWRSGHDLNAKFCKYCGNELPGNFNDE